MGRIETRLRGGSVLVHDGYSLDIRKLKRGTIRYSGDVGERNVELVSRQDYLTLKMLLL